MYIAFKWLLGLTLCMWFVMCGIDIFIKPWKKSNRTGIHFKEVSHIYENLTVSINDPPKQDILTNTVHHSENHQKYGFIHFAILCATGFFISIINNKKKNIIHAAGKIKGMNISVVHKYLNNLAHLKLNSIITYDTITKYLSLVWGDIERKIKECTVFKAYNVQRKINQEIINKALLQKLKDVSEEKKNLSFLLAASIFENRNIKFNYKLESMAKKRLAQYTEETEKKIKEVQAQNINFQHLYLIAYQENMHLQARLKKITELKEDAERNLITLVHEVCMSKNKKLMAFCSRFVVQTKDKLLRTDMGAEIQQFLTTTASIAQFKDSQEPDVGTQTKHSIELLGSDEINSMTPLLSEAPRLVGLPGEHIYTVKDKNGLIEKLYEYDFTTDFDNGDTIRRIREYSVYHDKDCFLENLNSRTIIHDNGCGEIFNKHFGELGSYNKIQNHRFLTGSEAFQIFLKNSRNLNIPLTASSKIPITYA